MNKNELRKLIKNKRSEMHACKLTDKISQKIVKHIKNSDIFCKSKNIALYYPIKGEIDLRKLLSVADKTYYFPKCKDNNLIFAKYDGQFVTGKYLIPETTGDYIDVSELDIMYIPALCCNKKCYRLGWGKGFYDRFFMENKISAKKIIVCPQCFVTDEFIEDEFDYQCDNILTEDGLI